MQTTILSHEQEKQTFVGMEDKPKEVIREMDSFSKMLAKPRRVFAGNWDLSATKFYDVATLLKNSKAIDDVMSSWRYKKFVVTMSVEASAAKSTSGAWGFGFVPTNQNTIDPTGITAANLTANYHVVMDVHANRVATRSSVWSAYREYSIAPNAGELGYFFLAPLTALRVATTGDEVSLDIKFWIDSMEFDVPQAQSSTHKFAMKPKACFGAAPYRKAGDYGVDTLWKRPTLHDVYTLSTSTVKGQTFGTIELDADDKSTASWVTSRMQERTGVYVVQLFAVATPFHAGRIEVVYDSVGSHNDTDGSTYKAVWDLEKTKVLDLRVHVREDNFSVQTFENKLRLRTWTGLLVQDGVPPNIDIVAYVHAEDLRGTALAQGYDLCPTNVITLGLGKSPNAEGYTLGELVEDKKFLLNQIPAADSGFNGVAINPNSYVQSRPFVSITGAVLNAPSNNPVDQLSGFFAFVDGAPKTYVRIGRKKMRLAFEGPQTFNRTDFTEYDGAVMISRNAVATNNQLGAIPIVDNVAGYGELSTFAVKTGDTLELDIPGIANRWNHERKSNGGTWVLYFAGVHERVETDPITYYPGLPSMVVTREFPKFYAMISRQPVY